MTQEELQQREFLTGQGDAGGAARHLAADQIDAEIGRLKLAFDDDRRPRRSRVRTRASSSAKANGFTR